ADAVNLITIDHPSAALIKLERKGSSWFLTAPVQAQADPYEVNGVLQLATSETKQTLDAAQVKPAELGLDPATYDVTFNDQKVEIGNVEPLKYRRYVRGGGRIALIEDPPSAALDADYSDLVAKNLVADGAKVVGVELPGLTLTQDADGKTLTLKPDDPKATAAQKAQLLEGWQRARAMWNALEGADSKLDPKADTVTLKLADGREQKYIVAARDPQLALVRPDLKIRYTLSKEDVDKLFKLPEEKPAPSADAKKADAAPLSTPAASN
ncbi:MAG TPA: DUF4340 domain-containing protein, partial [Nevskiaceae bacterium]|nr:DUF4340 domain-containing protein [Nevskiaceae bacterium]